MSESILEDNVIDRIVTYILSGDDKYRFFNECDMPSDPEGFGQILVNVNYESVYRSVIPEGRVKARPYHFTPAEIYSTMRNLRALEHYYYQVGWNGKSSTIETKLHDILEDMINGIRKDIVCNLPEYRELEVGLK